MQRDFFLLHLNYHDYKGNNMYGVLNKNNKRRKPFQV